MNITYPQELSNLPITRLVDRNTLDLKRSFCLIAHTGTGKTMVIPPAIVIETGRRVILRQPTRASALEVYNGLNKFWGQQMDIGIHTSDISVGSPKTHDIMVCTDGVLRNWMRKVEDDYTVIFDEIHQQMPVTEIEMGIIKTFLNEGQPFEIVLLSATIKPENLLTYFEDLGHGASATYIRDLSNKISPLINTMDQDQWLRLYYCEGVAHPIEDKIQQLDESEKGNSVMKFCKRMLQEGKRGIVFLPTRAMIIKHHEMCETRYPELTTNFAHADVNIQAVIDEVRDTEPHVLFSTTVFATSVTLPFDEVMIIDRGIDTVFQSGIERTVTDVPLNNNLILQMRGRVGRVKPGICNLVTNHRTSWRGIKPVDIAPPLSKCSPDQFVMTCASYNVDPTTLDVLTDINVVDVRKSVDKLKKWHLIDEDPSTWRLMELVEPDPETVPPGTLGLTNLGYRVMALPLELESAVMVARAPDNLLPAVIGLCSTEDGLYPMFRPHVTPTPGLSVKGIELLEPSILNPTSAVVTRIKILQAAMKARASEDTTLPEWAALNGIWPKKIERALKKFFDVCAALKKREREIRAELVATDLDALTPDIIDYMERTRIFQRLNLYQSHYKGEERYQGHYLAWNASLDSMEQSVMEIDRHKMGIVALGRPKFISKGDWTFVIWKDASLVQGR